MSTTYQTYDATEGREDPFFYPGEEEAAFETLAKDAMLDNFTTEELEAEVDRRLTDKFDEMPIMVGTHKMLDDFVNSFTTTPAKDDERMPF